MAQYGAPGVTQDAIDGNRAGIRLNEINRLVGGDVEALPIQEKIAAVLPNRGRTARLSDAAAPRRYLSTYRPGVRPRGHCKQGDR
jgi:hypothetical protein